MKPPIVAEIHRGICQSAKCEYVDKLNFNDPCASCPNGHWGQYENVDCADPSREVPQSGFGDVVAAVAQPIARTIDKIFKTNVAGCDGCKKRQEKLNQKFPLK